MPEESLGEAIRSILPVGVTLSAWEGQGAPPEYPEERPAIERAVARRVLEFKRGRACARAALAQLGVPHGPIPAGPDRAPIWPAGFVGSITHCAGLIAAIAAPAERFLALGLDAEPAGVLPSEVHNHVFHRLEGSSLEPSNQKVVFSAKESIFKALNPCVGVWLDFQDVLVELDPLRGRFVARAAPDAAVSTPELEALEGRYVVSNALVIAVSFLRGAPRR